MIPGLAAAALLKTAPGVPTAMRDFSFVHSLGGGGISSVATGVNFGAADPDRYIIVALTMNGQTTSGATGTVISATIGGVSATISHAHTLGSYFQFVTIIAKVPTGTSGSVSILVSGSAGVPSSRVYRVIGLQSMTKVASVANATATATLARPENGIILGAAVASYSTVGTRSATWTGLTKDIDVTTGNGRFATFAYGTIGPAQSFTPVVTLSQAPDFFRSIMLISLK